MLKRLAKSAIVARLASWLIGVYIRLVHKTSRWEVKGLEHFEKAASEGKGVILAFWHGRLLMAPTIRDYTDKRVFMLISSHRDGEIIANAVRSYGLEFIRGSAANPNKPGKNKGGASAILQMTTALNEGHVVCVTPDGPRGPGEKVQKGIIRLAQQSGASILPVAISLSHGRKMGSWDRFLLAAPFSRGVQVGGAPIKIPKEIDAEALESARLTLEKALLDVTQRADALVGRTD
ncbi:MAG: lysophospholipid acyltransferase family protein [Alphaproteobacteria bacterium]|nr:lysophospholipid acyltransferase family protein [Alphaproteobacteria bacterium]